MSRVSVTNTADRAAGLAAGLTALGDLSFAGREVFIKPNFNTADEPPGSSHNETILALVDLLTDLGAASISLGDRSYHLTAEVMARKGLLPELKKRGVRVIDFDELKKSDWVHFEAPGGHWPGGFHVARPVVEAESLVLAGCLKTHFIAGFTLSLKLAVGAVPTGRNGFDHMSRLHGSADLQKMVAEINQAFRPDLAVLDGVDAFVDGGPATGQRVRGEVILASADRVALDAVGLAALKNLGGNPTIMGQPIFSQGQIARAVELGLGAAGPAEIELVPAADQASRQLADRLRLILDEG